jgi:hypothetical protein
MTTKQFIDPVNYDDNSFLSTIDLIIKQTIDKTQLDLSNLTILTEAASGFWAFLPFIAAKSNAKEVICITKDSKFGNIQQIKNNFSKLKNYFDEKSVITVYDKLDRSLINKADVVTNSGHVRPINKNFISNMKQSSVISLMWEPWEFRDSDLDLRECWKNKIAILGVNEEINDLNIMKYDGQTIIKILNENKIIIKNKKIILIAENNSAHYMIKSLLSEGSEIFVITETMENEFDYVNVIGKNLNDKNVEQFLKICDVIIINSEPLSKQIIGDDGISISKLSNLCPNVSIFVYFGRVDYKQLSNSSLSFSPKHNPGSGYMSWNTDILGPRPVIELNTLGLKVGEILSRNKLKGMNTKEAEFESLKTKYCLGFSNEQKYRYA